MAVSISPYYRGQKEKRNTHVASSLSRHSVSANAARDVGGRLAALTIWGKDAAGGKYAAIAALTNFVAMIVAVVFYEVFFTDSSRGE
jgi:glycerol uptake facilitator-like aquaporin